MNDQPTRKWPRFVLGGVIIFLVVNAVWIYREVQRVKWLKSQRDTNAVFVLPPNSRPAPGSPPATNGR